MRRLIAIAGILLSVLLLAPAAHAHGAHKAPVKAAPAAPIVKTTAAPEREKLLGVCELPRDRFIAVDAPDPAAPPHHEADHDAASHSHPIGSDPFHDKASHGSLDTAHETRTASALGLPKVEPGEPAADDAPCGIVVKPPVPPPLG